jgi:hypothetical protein
MNFDMNVHARRLSVNPTIRENNSNTFSITTPSWLVARRQTIPQSNCGNGGTYMKISEYDLSN